MSSPSPAAHEGTDCNGCGRFVAYAPCKSDRNGNKGRMVATVCDLSICIHICADYMHFDYSAIASALMARLAILFDGK